MVQTWFVVFITVLCLWQVFAALPSPHKGVRVVYKLNILLFKPKAVDLLNKPSCQLLKQAVITIITSCC